MPRLIVRQAEQKIMKRLKAHANLHDVPRKEVRRRMLRKALMVKGERRPSFKDFLLTMPDVGPDSIFERVSNS